MRNLNSRIGTIIAYLLAVSLEGSDGFNSSPSFVYKSRGNGKLASPKVSSVSLASSVVNPTKSPETEIIESFDNENKDYDETNDINEDQDIDEIELDEENEKQLVLQFVQMVQNSPPGELDIEEVHLLREIMLDFPSDIDNVEPAPAVESLLYRLLDEWEAALGAEDFEKEEAYRPSSDDFETALSAWEASKNPDKTVRVLSILSDQRELFMNGLTPVKPTLSGINTILKALSVSRDRGVDKRASQVFESLSDFGLVPDAETYTLMVIIIAKGRSKGAGRRAEKLLRQAIKEYPPSLVNGVKSGIQREAFNALVTAYAKSGEDNGPDQAENVIVLMDTLDAETGCLGICSPDAKTFTSLIDAYAQRNEWEPVNQADRILNRLLEQYLEGNEDLEPSVATWTIVISAWTRLSKKNRRGAAERAGRLLRRMEDLHLEGRISCKPDAITFVTCMNAYAYSKSAAGAEEAEKLLDEMNEMYLDGDDSMKPSARSVKVIIEGWVKSGDLERAEDLLDRYEDSILEDGGERTMSDLKDIYQTMLFGYCQQQDTERAVFYLNYMVEKDMEPQCIDFDRVLDANAKLNDSNSLKRSLEVFETMEKFRQSSESFEPNERTYTSFIRALTKGRAPNLHKKAEVLLKRMHKLYEAGNYSIKPTVFTYNAIINACAEASRIEDAPTADSFKTALGVFSELRSSKTERPDHVTYGNLLRCAMLLPEGEKRDKFVIGTFKVCSEEGYVNDLVLRDLQKAAPESLWRSLLRCTDGEPSIEYLPYEWSENIRAKKEKVKKSRW